MTQLKVLSVASEIYPLIKTGGLADVTGALPLALANEGADMRTLIPGYPAVLSALQEAQEITAFPGLFGSARLLVGKAHGLNLFVLDAPYLYGRPGNPYIAPDGSDWPDNAYRFGALAKVAAEIGLGLLPAFRPDVVHMHDWQAGLTVAYMHYSGKAAPGTVMTVHNLAFQGQFPAELVMPLGLPPAAFAWDGVEHYGQIGFLKAGLQLADRITTVSPSYAMEIMQPETGMGFDGLLRARAAAVSGILNGLDTAVWDPANDPLIEKTYDAAHLDARAANKAILQNAFGLSQEPGSLVAGVVSRLTWQKGLDLLLEALPTLVGEGMQLALLGSGEAELEAKFLAAAGSHPGKIGVSLGYDETLAHRIQAGADALLVPSRFEPCGLTQLAALRYGAVPVVARVGGLSDTVIDANEMALATGVATGVQFAPVTSDCLAAALWRTAKLFRDRGAWRTMQKNGMETDVSWRRRARSYANLYRELCGSKGRAVSSEAMQVEAQSIEPARSGSDQRKTAAIEPAGPETGEGVIASIAPAFDAGKNKAAGIEPAASESDKGKAQSGLPAIPESGIGKIASIVAAGIETFRRIGPASSETDSEEAATIQTGGFDTGKRKAGAVEPAASENGEGKAVSSLPASPESGKGEADRMETANLEALKSKVAGIQPAGPEAAKSKAAGIEPAASENGKAKAVSSGPAGSETGKGEAARIETANLEALKSKVAGIEPAGPEAAKSKAAGIEPASSENGEAKAVSSLPASPESGRGEAARTEIANLEASKSKVAGIEPAGPEAAKSNAADIEPASSEAGKSKAAAIEPAASENGKAKAVSSGPAGSETGKGEAARIETANLEALKSKVADFGQAGFESGKSKVASIGAVSPEGDKSKAVSSGPAGSETGRGEAVRIETAYFEALKDKVARLEPAGPEAGKSKAAGIEPASSESDRGKAASIEPADPETGKGKIAGMEASASEGDQDYIMSIAWRDD